MGIAGWFSLTPSQDSLNSFQNYPQGRVEAVRVLEFEQGTPRARRACRGRSTASGMPENNRLSRTVDRAHCAPLQVRGGSDSPKRTASIGAAAHFDMRRPRAAHHFQGVFRENTPRQARRHILADAVAKQK